MPPASVDFSIWLHLRVMRLNPGATAGVAMAQVDCVLTRSISGMACVAHVTVAHAGSWNLVVWVQFLRAALVSSHRRLSKGALCPSGLRSTHWLANCGPSG